MNENYCHVHTWLVDADELVTGPDGKGICLNCAADLGLKICEFPGCNCALEVEDLLINDGDLVICKDHTLEEITEAGYPYCICCKNVVSEVYDSAEGPLCKACIDSSGMYICTVGDCEIPAAYEEDMLVIDYDNEVFICNCHN